MDPRQTARLEAINKKGWAVAQKLQELRAKQDVSLADLLPDDKDPREPPIVRLRRFLELINAARVRLLTGGYGRCLQCGAPFTDLELDEVPWADLCRPCAARNAG